MKKQLKSNGIKKPIHFYVHLARNVSWGIILTAAALFIGMVGYHVTEGLSWIDSFLNASMILSGMGPANTLNTVSGKLFAGFYALFSGLAFIAIIVIILSPLVHRFFRKIHLEGANTHEEKQD